VGAEGLPKGVEPGPDTAVFPAVDTETEYGWKKKVKMRLPIFTGALGSTEIARRNWEHFAMRGNVVDMAVGIIIGAAFGRLSNDRIAEMEKNEREGRIIWIKSYQLTDAGKWFALLLAEEKELTEKEKAEILQSLFRTYVKMVKGLAEEIGISKKMLEDYVMGYARWRGLIDVAPATRARSSKSELWLVPIQGGETRKLDLVAPNMRELSVHPDGRPFNLCDGIVRASRQKSLIAENAEGAEKKIYNKSLKKAANLLRKDFSHNLFFQAK
jgi:hypothetical protein